MLGIDRTQRLPRLWWLALSVELLSITAGCNGRVDAPPVDAGPQVTDRPPAPLDFQQRAFFPPHRHTIRTDVTDESWGYLQQGGGLALADVNGDGRDDLFASGGESGHHVFLNQGGGRFVEDPLALPTIVGFVSSATFADVDGDGDQDLLLSHLLAERGLTFLRNRGGRFVDATDAVGLGSFAPPAAWSTSFSDIDGDGDLDVFVAQWVHWDTVGAGASPHMFCNDGAGRFRDCSTEMGLTQYFEDHRDSSLTSTFTDFNEDGFIDLLMTGDFGHSHIFEGHGAAGFTTLAASAFLAIEFGMGSVVSDFDNDLHMDWFVTAIHVPYEDFNSNGNRLMLGDGRGGLRDVSESAGVSEGGWGWAACASDFDLDGDVDLFHVNGYEVLGASGTSPFAQLGELVLRDRSRLFLNDGTAHFVEAAALVGLDDPAHLTATVCTDLDDDGDVDIVTLEVGGDLRAYENTLGGGVHFLTLDLDAPSPNRQAVGARVSIHATGRTQIAERRIDNTHTSAPSPRLHFGLLSGEPVDVEVQWPGGVRTQHLQLAADQHHRLVQR